MVIIQEGRFYKTVQGHKIGPAVRNEDGTIYKWSLGGPWRHQDDGTAGDGTGEKKYYSAVSEWPSSEDGPIREVRRREIVPGVYGGFVNVDVCEKNVFVSIRNNPYSPEQLREAAHLFNQLAEVLEEQG